MFTSKFYGKGKSEEKAEKPKMSHSVEDRQKAAMEANKAWREKIKHVEALDENQPRLSMAAFTDEMKRDADSQKSLIPIVAELLSKLVEANDKVATDREHITVFHAQKAPAVNVIDYAERIAKYSSCSYCCFVVGIIYMDRFIQRQRMLERDFRINSLNVHRLLLASVMVAAKFLDDFYYSNEFWAKIGGVPNVELNTLEIEFLFLTNFELHVARDVYDSYREELLAWNHGAPSRCGKEQFNSLLCEVRQPNPYFFKEQASEKEMLEGGKELAATPQDDAMVIG
uniref:Cyclin n=1 Tax=Hanusia phi TaxID=3032 RepID=A0A7S0EVZ1_9CRYP|mmetsp:Transcript_30663/g.69191  ORF Transcript_30663/g.69191 Transcript_30663/m.69191 type:complete len:284 (+) Transcript_30663:327-1178(+)